MQSPDLQSLVAGQVFRDAMTLLAAPITVVTTVDGQGRRWGMTASSVTSGSLEPPLVLVAVSRRSSCHRALVSSSQFVINVLADEHRELARTFSESGVDRFSAHEFSSWPGHGLPCLPDASAALRCHNHGVHQVGDHDLLIGALAEVRFGAPKKALLWYQRAFHTPD